MQRICRQRIRHVHRRCALTVPAELVAYRWHARFESRPHTREMVLHERRDQVMLEDHIQQPLGGVRRFECPAAFRADDLHRALEGLKAIRQAILGFAMPVVFMCGQVLFSSLAPANS